ncbi:MAG: translation initiation factor IF-2 subunit gamma [Methanobacteriota archaeon]|nr:MAG: translation initiation factor IF-2 subunit gamma [Euryarchaeota archaeon]
MLRQAEINIGMVGHVDHGKTTLTKAISGVWTDTHSEELKRGISIRLGYADATFYQCPQCSPPEAYSTSPKCPHCGSATKVLRRVSFVDSPGHETLMATMLSGASLMDGAMLVIAANEKCPQPQTVEHLMALDIIGVRNIIVVQNKIDLVSKEETLENYRQIREFIRETCAADAPIIPISAQHSANIDILIQAIEERIPTPERDPNLPPFMYIARSFDINKPGTPPEKLRGGVIGGSLKQGVLRVGDTIEILPGQKKMVGGREKWVPIHTKIVSLSAGGTSLEEAHPGGLIGVGTQLDPRYVKSDSLGGGVVGREGELPPVLEEVSLETHLLERVVGSAEQLRVTEIKNGETMMISSGTATTIGVVNEKRGELVNMRLRLPICAETGNRVALSRRVGARWRLIGYGIIQ